MNLLEHYIKKIVSEEPWEKDKRWIRVTVDVDCWGNKSRMTTVFSKEVWEKAKKRGYFLA